MSAPGTALPLAVRAPAVSRASTVPAISWALAASMLHRVRRGEGALLAVNLSLAVLGRGSSARALAQALVSALAITLMYAFNDLHDAPIDRNNPKKNRALIATYVAQRRGALRAIFVMKLLTLGIALVALGAWSTAALAGVLIVNVVYSVFLKGVPVADVAWVCLWGVLYAAIVTTSASLLVVVGLMTAVCHLFQALGDRVPDAESGIHTTAVRSPVLARGLLVVLVLLLSVALAPPLGVAGALSACIPLVIFLVCRTPGTAWLLTKAYFGIMWLCLLGTLHAAG